MAALTLEFQNFKTKLANTRFVCQETHLLAHLMINNYSENVITSSQVCELKINGTITKLHGR